MVDCNYYEEMFIDKKAIKEKFESKFGDSYNILEDIASDSFIITAEDILKPKPEVYAQILSGLSSKFLTTTKVCPDIIQKRYYNSIFLLSLIDQASTPATIEKLEAHPLVCAVRYKLKEFS